MVRVSSVFIEILTNTYVILLILHYFQDSDADNDEWTCVNKECLYHNHHDDTLIINKIVDDEAFVNDDNDEWICVNKDCLYHNHILEYDDVNVDDEFVIEKLY